MPTSADNPDPTDPIVEGLDSGDPGTVEVGMPESAKALTESERKKLLAENRRVREEARRKEVAKSGDGEAADAVSGGEDETEVIDPARVPGVVTAPARPNRPVRGLLIGLCALIAALLIGLGVLGYFYAQSQDGRLGPDSGIGQQAMADAQQYAAEMLTYQPGGYADLDRRIRAIATPDFADRYIEASPEARRGNDAAEVTSVGTAVDAGLTSISGDHAVVLVAVDHTLSSPELPSAGADGVTYQRRVKVTLTRDGDRWLVADFVTI
ncbi:MAG: hypothetical protein WAW85_10885 [Gordonia sp. (in: high G+C Gram-positive bacteria)]|uniref:hypothetical protein n=1 Tax=Gordonia sp. (in: high G+C Gram-positive bacteria) TaxID=84139 RepID=UPI003BB59019